MYEHLKLKPSTQNAKYTKIQEMEKIKINIFQCGWVGGGGGGWGRGGGGGGWRQGAGSSHFKIAVF